MKFYLNWIFITKIYVLIILKEYKSN